MADSATDVLVLGTGIAGTAAALAAAREGVRVTIVTRAAEATQSNTFWAQGGIVGRPPGDTPERLAADIERAGDGLCSPEAALLLAREGPDLVEKLLVEELGVPFDREGAGSTGRSRARTRFRGSSTSRTRPECRSSERCWRHAARSRASNGASRRRPSIC